MHEYSRGRWFSLALVAASWPEHARIELGEYIVALAAEHNDDELRGTGLALTYRAAPTQRRREHATA